jgi:outer membrane protein TolC
LGASGSPAEGVSTSLGGALNLSQNLPSGGALSLTAGNTLIISGPEDNPDQIYAQNPQFSVNLYQPLLINGQILDLRLLQAGENVAKSGLDLASLSRRQEANAQFIDALRSYGDWWNLALQINILGSQLEVFEERLKRARVSLDAGIISSSQFISIELEKEQLNQSLLQLRLNQFRLREQLENEWSIIIDDDIDDFITLVGSLELSDEPTTGDINQNPALRSLSLSQRLSEASHILGGMENASTLNVNFFLEPGYDSSDYSMTPGTFTRTIQDSWTELFTEESLVNWGVNVTYSLSLDALTKEARRNEQFELEKAKALKDIDRFRQTAEALWSTFLSEWSILLEDETLQLRSVELARRELANEETKLALGQVDPLTVKQVESKVQQAEADLYKIRWERFLLELRVRDFLGEDLL